ncbi:hypothetical protein E4U42_001443 [Claviceps africana]|uniref:Putative gamma-glutamylcyclotransferase n=1 Tax=Claviceps africana TaxID=83212 RepID=A0A8K0IZW2_9HYPO|nr:hypothetical protein E4U42_001443 [Claviceps africana]
MAPEIFFSVCYGDKNPPKMIRDLHTFTPALLQDFCRHRVKSADYPGAVPEAGHQIRGVLVTGLTDANVDKLDLFEGSDYERRIVQVQVLGNVEDEKIPVKEVGAFVYVFLKVEDLEKREWDFEEFRRDKMMLWTSQDLMTYGLSRAARFLVSIANESLAGGNDRAVVNAAV